MKSKSRGRLRTAEYFQERAARADVDETLKLLERAGDEPPREGDEIALDLRRRGRSRRSQSSATGRR
jgi:hypothetical protein